MRRYRYEELVTKTGVSVVSIVLATAMLLVVYAVGIVVPVTSLTEASPATISPEGIPAEYPVVYGYTYDADGVTPLNGCVVTIMDVRTGEAIVWDENSSGWDPTINIYVVTMALPSDYIVGDVFNVTATKGTQIGWNEGIAPLPLEMVQIDVTLSAEKFTMDLVTGWNFVSLPLVCYGYKASTLGLNSGDTVSEWNSTTKTYRNHIVGIPVNDFAISPGTGYEINVPSGTRTLAFYGVTPTASQSKTITVPAGGGWATVGFVGKNTTRHASDVPGMYSVPGSITIVSTWNPITKVYRNWLSVIPSLNDFVLTPGLAYWILAGASGTLTYEPAVPPVASFTYTTDGLTVNVDAASSSGYGIVSYTLDWGDGSPAEVFATPTASHTYGSYAPAVTTSMKSRPVGWAVFGCVYLLDGVTPAVGATVTVANLRSGYSETLTTYDGWYSTALVENPDGPPDSGGPWIGDIINVTAVNDTLIGWNEGVVVDTPEGYLWLDVTLSGLRPGYWITLTVTDTLGQTGTMTQLVILPMGVPTLTSPANGATNVSLTSTFTWIAPEGTNYNDIYIGSGGWSATHHSNTSSIVFTLDPGHTWIWRVRSSFDGGITYGGWSATWTFTTVH